MTESQAEAPDPAAVFACAVSLWEACHKQKAVNLSDMYNGIDQLMREVMRVANLFEEWACLHVAFDQVTDVWPYKLEEHFGSACLTLLGSNTLMQFNEEDCLKVALHLQLPVWWDSKLPVPVDLRAKNPLMGSGFGEFRIRTVRDLAGENEAIPFVVCDEPFDENFDDPFFAIYGVNGNGLDEHITDRGTYSEALAFLKKLAPGIGFPEKATSPTSPPL
jgi:hypothetical protein